MRLVFFDFNLNYGGGPQGSIYLARRLNDFHEVHVVDAYGQCKAYIDAVRAARLPIHILKPSGGRVFIGGHGISRFINFGRWLPEMFELRMNLVRLILKIRPDVLWVNNEKSLVLLASSCRLSEFPLAIYFRGWGTADQLSLLLRWLIKRRAAAVIVHAAAALQEFRKARISYGKVHCVQNCIDVPALHAEADKGPAEDLPGKDRKLKLLLPAARLTHQKGQSTAIRAVARLKRVGIEPTLWLTGVTSVGVENDYENELRALIHSFQLEDNVFLLGWRNDMAALLCLSDIVVLPSHTEGLPRAILEAMHLEKPVCATPVGGIPEAIEDGKTGFLFDVEDDAGLALKIRILVEQQHVQESIIKNARNLAARHFSATKHTEDIMSIFEKIRRK